jgi:phenylalanine-4-hydroxylase
MKQLMHTYTQEDSAVWNLLTGRQLENIQNKVSGEYLNALGEMNDVLNMDEIPEFERINKWFTDKTEWSIETVKGLIPVEDFFRLLAEKKFCSSTWLRSKKNMNYLEEPDMFHDIFGHIPLLSNPVFSEFVSEFGKIGLHHINDQEKLIELQRLYWFTIEFGVIMDQNKLKAYGAGIISSLEETNKVYDEKGDFHAFNLNDILKRDFHTDKVQEAYFVISSFDDLYNSLSKF